MSNEEIRPLDKFLVLHAIYSKAAEQVSTKCADNLRSEIERGYRDEYERTGAKSFSLKLNGEKVGTYSISESRGTPPRQTREFEATDDAALDNWVRGEEAQTYWDAFITSHRFEFAKWYFECMGELPDGCEMVTHETRGTLGGTYKGASLRGFDADKVLELATKAGYIGGAAVPLLGGGAE